MPKKTSDHARYAEAARDYLKRKRKELGGNKALYKAIYGFEPDDSQNQALINLLNRGNLSAEFLGLCVDKLNLSETSVFELFGIRKPIPLTELQVRTKDGTK